MPIDPQNLRLERVSAEVGYDPSLAIDDLRAVAERRAQGPTFGSFVEESSGQMTLRPSGDNSDQRLVGALAPTLSSLFAEGPMWTPRSRTVAIDWFEDTYAVLKPQRTVAITTDFLALYPIPEPYATSQRLIDRYYKQGAIEAFAGLDKFFVVVEVFAVAELPHSTSIVWGVVGPSHRGMFFTFSDTARDESWWLGLRLVYRMADEAGISNPLGALHFCLDRGHDDLARIARSELPALVGSGE